MGIFDFLISLVFLLAAVTIGGYLIWIVIAQFLSGTQIVSLPTAKRRPRKLRKAAKRIERVDALLDAKKPEEALRELRKAVVLDVTVSVIGISSFKEHHQNILSRCVLIAEELESRPEFIAEVEGLVMERVELHELKLKVKDSFSRLRNRREQAGKELPNWSKNEYENRSVQVKEELRRNRRELEMMIDKLFDSLKTPVTENIVYH